MLGNVVDEFEGYLNLPSNEFYIPLIFMINSCRFMTADERSGSQRVLAYINQMFNPSKLKKNVKKKKEVGMTAQEKTKAKEDEQIIQNLINKSQKVKKIWVLVANFAKKIYMESLVEEQKTSYNFSKPSGGAGYNEQQEANSFGQLSTMPVPQLIDYFIMYYLNDVPSEILVFKIAFSKLEEIFEQKARRDNSLASELKEFRQYVNRQPISMFDISQDDYDKIEKEEMIRVRHKFKQKFLDICVKMFVKT